MHLKRRQPKRKKPPPMLVCGPPQDPQEVPRAGRVLSAQLRRRRRPATSARLPELVRTRGTAPRVGTNLSLLPSPIPGRLLLTHKPPTSLFLGEVAQPSLSAHARRVRGTGVQAVDTRAAWGNSDTVSRSRRRRSLASGGRPSCLPNWVAADPGAPDLRH